MCGVSLSAEREVCVVRAKDCVQLNSSVAVEEAQAEAQPTAEEARRALEVEVVGLREEKVRLEQRLRTQSVDLCRLRTTLASAHEIQPLTGVF